MRQYHIPRVRLISPISVLSLASYFFLTPLCHASLTVTTNVTGEVVFDQHFWVEWTGGDASTYKVLVQEQETTGDGAAVTVASSATSPYSYSFNTGVWKEGHFVFIVESDDEQADSNILTLTSSIDDSTSTTSTSSPTTISVAVTTTSSPEATSTSAAAASSSSSSSSSAKADVAETASSTASSTSSTTASSASSTSEAGSAASDVAAGTTSSLSGSSTAGAAVAATTSQASSGLSTGAAIGIGVGVGIAGLCLLAGLLLFVYRRGVKAAAAKNQTKELAGDGSFNSQPPSTANRAGSGGAYYNQQTGMWEGAPGDNIAMSRAKYGGVDVNSAIELSKDPNRPYHELHPDSAQFAELGHNDTSYYAELAAARENTR